MIARDFRVGVVRVWVRGSGARAGEGRCRTVEAAVLGLSVVVLMVYGGLMVFVVRGIHRRGCRTAARARLARRDR